MNPSSKWWLCLTLCVALGGCLGGKKATRPESKPIAGKPAAKPEEKPAEVAKPAVPAKSPDEQFAAALTALKAKNFDEARTGFEKLAKEHPEFSGPLSNLGVLDSKAGKREAAIADFSRAVAANPENAMAYNWLGLLYRETKAYPESEKAYLKAIDLKADYAQPQLNLGILYEVYLNRPGEALSRYRNYQQLSGNKELKVVAWIKNLEEAGVVPPTVAPAAKPVVTPGAEGPGPKTRLKTKEKKT